MKQLGKGTRLTKVAADDAAHSRLAQRMAENEFGEPVECVHRASMSTMFMDANLAMATRRRGRKGAVNAPSGTPSVWAGQQLERDDDDDRTRSHNPKQESEGQRDG